MENQENQNPSLESVKPNQPYPKPEVSSQTPKKKQYDNIFVRGIIVIALILVMLLPTPFILNLIQERAERQGNNVKEISKQYGGNQTLYGPFIKIPYNVMNSEGLAQIQYTYLAPQNLNINGGLYSVLRTKGIYNIVLYHSKLNFDSYFNEETFSQLDPHINYDFSKSKLVFGVSDINGLEDNINYTVNGNIYSSKVGETVDMGEVKNNTENNKVDSVLIEELEVPIIIPENKNIKISFPLSIKGTGALNFLPVSKKTEVKIKTKINNKNLGFEGSILPLDIFQNKERILQWKVPSKGRNLVWTNTSDILKNKFGVNVLQSYDEYGKTNRVAKYSILFIGLTFITFFFIEIINKLKIHPVQYVLVGLALSVFYLLLLSISEYIGFNYSYIISASATILLICWFIKGIVKKTQIMGGIFIVLALLYTYIFVIIQLDELALLAGSIGLFIILALLMYFSRKIEWKTE